MIVGVHQPNYLPYLGFFDKMRRSDIFVIYDDAQFVKGDFHNRNRIRIYHGFKWLTVPVEMARLPINEIKIKNEVLWKGDRWSEAHLRDIRDNYKDTPYYDLYESDIEVLYRPVYEKLIDLNMNLINFLKKAFNIDTKIVFSSEFGLASNATDRLIEIVEAVGGEVYLSGAGGRDYLDIVKFENRGINVEFQDFKHPVYRQRYEGFIPDMAAVDILFNVGKVWPK
jgi:hypothetical protein